MLPPTTQQGKPNQTWFPVALLLLHGARSQVRASGQQGCSLTYLSEPGARFSLHPSVLTVTGYSWHSPLANLNMGCLPPTALSYTVQPFWLSGLFTLLASWSGSPLCLSSYGPAFWSCPLWTLPSVPASESVLSSTINVLLHQTWEEPCPFLFISPFSFIWWEWRKWAPTQGTQLLWTSCCSSSPRVCGSFVSADFGQRPDSILESPSSVASSLHLI